MEEISANANVTFLLTGNGGLEIGALGSDSGNVSGFGQNTHQFIDFTAIGSASASASYTSTSSDGGC